MIDDGKRIKDQYSRYGRDSAMIVEELIVEADEIHKIHPYSVNPVRFTTILMEDGVKVFYPWIKLGCSREFVANAANGGIVALINEDTGIITTKGYSEHCLEYDVHPETGFKIEGVQIPEWDDLKSMLVDAAQRFPTIRYIGWDAVLSENGWCIMEGNAYGIPVMQLPFGRGLKDEFEDLVGWAPPYDFWWQNDEVFTRDGRLRT